MRVSRIRLEGFGPHDSLDVTLPETGLVLITGHNGAGKSTMIEAASWSVWGKTLRGAPMYRSKEACSVTLETDAGTVQRARTASGRGSVRLVDAAGLDTEFDTAADAQVALSQVFGASDVWRRTHVFSSNDPVLFSAASDGDKKRLLELLLGLDKFDRALTSCRRELTAAKQNLQGSEALMVSCKQLVEAEDRNFSQIKGSLATMQDAEQEDPESVHIRIGECTEKIEACRKSVDALEKEDRKHRDERNGLTQGLARLVAQKDQAKKNYESVQSGQCAACDGEIPADKLETLQKEAENTSGVAQEAAKSAHEAMSKIDERLAEIRAEQGGSQNNLRSLAATKARLETLQAESQKYEKTRENLQKSVELAQNAIKKRTAELGAAREGYVVAKESVQLLQYVESVLGLKGVRAHILGNALDGIEDATNAWLSRIASRPMSLSLSSTDKGALTLEVKGAGGDHGYKGASGGERRRIDIALLLALADMASGANGREPGTLWLDEVLDAIDDEGVGLLASALQEVASRRQVVLVTHSETLAHAVGQFAVQHMNLTGND